MTEIARPVKLGGGCYMIPHNLAHQTFDNVADLDRAIHNAVEDLNHERALVPLAKPRISA
jgi:hypothetical protein